MHCYTAHRELCTVPQSNAFIQSCAVLAACEDCNWPVGIREGDEGELFGAVQHQVLSHLTEMGQTQWSPEQELH